MTFAREQAVNARVQIQAMKEAGEELGGALAELPDQDDLADQQYELNEMLQQTEELNSLLSTNFDTNAVSDADLEAELAGMDADFAAIPDAPVYNPAQAQAQFAPQAGAGVLPSAPAAPAQWQLPQQPLAAGGGGGGGGGGGAAANPYASGISSVRM